MKALIEWAKLAYTGLCRHSAMILDDCGFPLWFIRLYCPAPIGWGRLLRELCDRLYIEVDNAA
jgi:hypothetical protein